MDSDFKSNTRVPVVGTDSRIKHLAFLAKCFFSAMYLSIIVDDGVGLLIADVGFLVDDGRSVFYADAVGYFASDP